MMRLVALVTLAGTIAGAALAQPPPEGRASEIVVEARKPILVVSENLSRP